MKTIDYTKGLYEVNLHSGKDTADAISNFLNGLGRDKQKEFIDTMGRDHGCLQQKFTSLCCDWIKHLAVKTYYSPQMEDSIEFAKEVIQKVHPDKMRMPLI